MPCPTHAAGISTGCDTSEGYGLESAEPMISVYRRPRCWSGIGTSQALFDAGRLPLTNEAIQILGEGVAVRACDVGVGLFTMAY